MTTSGFVAGTLVHTDKGLVPIEQLKVGDRVLSKHESGEGEQVYKRVVKTFKSAEKLPIVRVSFLGTNVDEKNGEMHLFCTGNHPFWVVGKGWQLASQLIDSDSGGIDLLIDLNDKPAIVRDFMCFVRTTSVPDIALSANSSEWKEHDGFSMMIDFRNNKPILIGGGGSLFSGISDSRSWHPDEDIHYLPKNDAAAETQFYYQAIDEDFRRADDALFNNLYRAYVYNIEIEDFHTYFIGKAGILTHTSANITP